MRTDLPSLGKMTHSKEPGTVTHVGTVEQDKRAT